MAEPGPIDSAGCRSGRCMLPIYILKSFCQMYRHSRVFFLFLSSTEDQPSKVFQQQNLPHNDDMTSPLSL